MNRAVRGAQDSHSQIRSLLQSGVTLDVDQRRQVEEHLTGCSECREYADFVTWLSGSLPESYPQPRHSPAAARQAGRRISERLHHQQRRARMLNVFGTLAWSGAAVVMVFGLGWLIRNAIYRPDMQTPAAPIAMVTGSAASPAAPSQPAEPTSELPQPTAAPEGVEPLPTSLPALAGWKWYTHPQLNYRMAHPQDWQAIPEAGAVEGSLPEPASHLEVRPASGEPTIAVDAWEIQEAADFSLLEWIEAHADALVNQDSGAEVEPNVEIAGQTGFYLYSPAADEQVEKASVLFASGDHVYRVQLSDPGALSDSEWQVMADLLSSFSLAGVQTHDFRIPTAWNPAQAPAVSAPAAPAAQPGWLVFASERAGQSALYAMHSAGGEAILIAGELSEISNPAWSPDGSRIAFQASAPGGADLDIFTLNLDGALKQLTEGGGDDFDPAWSPDGQQIVFASSRDRAGRAEIYTMKANGNSPKRLTHNNAWQAQPAWSPDGNKIAFYSEQDGNAEIYFINVDGSGQTRLTEEPGGDASPTWSPDGAKIAFASERAGKSDIFTMFSDGSAPTNLTESPDAWDTAPEWANNGTAIAYVKSGGDAPNGLYVMQVDGNHPTWIAGTSDLDGGPDWYTGNGQPAGLDDLAASAELLPTPTPNQPADAEQPTPTPTAVAPAELAGQSLRDFFSRLANQEYQAAANLYGGSLEALIAAGPGIDPADQAALWKNACETAGYACLEVRSITLQPAGSPGYTFLVEFTNPDGTLFSLPPADGQAGEGQSRFLYTVIENDNRYLVQNLPVKKP